MGDLEEIPSLSLGYFGLGAAWQKQYRSASNGKEENRIIGENNRKIILNVSFVMLTYFILSE